MELSFVLTGSEGSAQRLRNLLSTVGALLWANGNLLAVRADYAHLKLILAQVGIRPDDVKDVEVYDRAVPELVLRRLSPATQLFVRAQSAPITKGPSKSARLSWDAVGKEAPQHLDSTDNGRRGI